MTTRFSRLGLIAFGLLLLGGSCRRSPDPSPPQPAHPVPVQIVRPARGPITRSVTLPGNLQPYQQATLYAKVAGYLKTITVDKGDPIEEGALIADIEAPELLADEAKCRAELDLAEIDLKRTGEAQSKAPDLVVPLALDTARARRDTAKASLDRARVLLQFTRITAPFTGIVTKRFVDPGAFIPAATSGSAAQNAAIVSIADFRRIRVQVAVPELEAPLIVTNLPVILNVNGLPGREFQGRVTRFAFALDDATKTMLTEIELPNPRLELRPGMYALVKIGIERKDDALLVPAEAVLVEKAGASVFLLADNKARKVPIKTGFNDAAHFEILGGLQGDEPILMAGKRTLNDGQPVTVTDGK